MDYFVLVQSGIDYIEENITETLTVSAVAKTALCSEDYFGRIFHAIVGVTVSEYIRKRRLSLAARNLALRKPKVIDVSLHYGYETPEAFAKAFKRFHGVTPSVCRKTGEHRYYNRIFPMVIKYNIQQGEMDMSKFGSPLQEIIQNLDQASEDLYYCFQFRNEPYAIPAIYTNEICGLDQVYTNKKNQPFRFLRGFTIPLYLLEDTVSWESCAIMKHNILIIKSQKTWVLGDNPYVLGIITEGNPELNLCTQKEEYTLPDRPYVTAKGVFGNQTIPIISTEKLIAYAKPKIANDFEQDKRLFEEIPTTDALSRLEYSAYNLELLARNASIEACNGMSHHKGTMVVAYEMHELANEVAEIAKELRHQ